MEFTLLRTNLFGGECRYLLTAAACLFLTTLASCSSLGSSGPTSAAINAADKVTIANARVKVIDINDFLARRVAAAHLNPPLSLALGDAPQWQTVVGPGDVLQVTIWESPPAVLFGGSTSFGSAGGSISNMTSEHSDIPEMMVDEQGRIQIPFAGYVNAAGRTPQEVEQVIAEKLAGMAHDPQVTVRIARNESATVAVLGAVGSSGRVPVTPRGERVLDAIAGAGGVTQPIDKVTVQITRGGRIANAPLEDVIRDSGQNVRLGPGDIVNVLYQPFSFTALGATVTSGEIPFESTGLTLAQALGRVGGLKEDRANARGAFIFRFEDVAAVDPAIAQASPLTPDGRIPIIYRVDLRDPTTLFAAQHFPMRDDDILYVATAPVPELQRFVNILSSMAFTIIGLGQTVPGL